MTDSSTAVSDTVIVEADHLEEFAARVFEVLGMSAEHASLMAEHITWAHVHGHPWLGGRKIMQYGTRIKTGVTAAVGNATVVSESDAFVLLGAGDTFSQIAGVEAMRRTIEKAREVAVLERAVRWFAQFGITIRRLLNHNGSCYKSKLWHRTCRGMCIRVKNTRLHTIGRGLMT